MNRQLGSGSLFFEETPFIISKASIVGTKEGEGPLAKYFDEILEEDKAGQQNWEQAESMIQKRALELSLDFIHLPKERLRYIFAGDLLGQTIASSFGMMDFQVPVFGIYGACSTCGEGLGLGAMTVSAGYAEELAVVTSSHFASAERQFRFPLEYANQRPKCATWTVTGGAAFVLSRKNNGAWAKIRGITTGKIVDYGIRDAMNMGAAMAPAAADLIAQNLKDFNYRPEDYDAIVTGDLGLVGSEILMDLMLDKGYDISKQHQDCGVLIFDCEKQGVGSGGSGCGCSATTLAAWFLPHIKNKTYQRILFVPTGALLSPVSFNEGQSVPGIAHGIVLESC